MRKDYLYEKEFIQIQIICDFDGTVTPVDTTDAILSHFAPPQWETIENEWLAGKINAHECMRRQIALLKINKGRLNNFLEKIVLTRGFASFVNYAKCKKIDVAVVSDGLDYVINYLLMRYLIHGLPVIANKLNVDRQGCSLEFPYKKAGCGQGVCKCAVAKSYGAKKIILIGDGRSDFCLAEQADFVLAKAGASLESHCHELSIPYATYDDFYDVIEFFDSISMVIETGYSENEIYSRLIS